MQTTITWADGDQVTSAKLNEITSGLSFDAGDVTGTTLVVTGGLLKVGTITSSEMGAGSVAATALATDAVTTAKLADGSITTGKVANLAITGAKIANGTITMANLSSGLSATQSVMVAETGGYVVTPDFVKHAPGAAKAYGEFNITSSSRAIKTNAVNIQSLTRIDSTHTTVSLTANMSGIFYTVLATFVSTGTTAEAGLVGVYDKSATGFKIFHPAEAAERAINFVVFGKYA